MERIHTSILESMLASISAGIGNPFVYYFSLTSTLKLTKKFCTMCVLIACNFEWRITCLEKIKTSNYLGALFRIACTYNTVDISACINVTSMYSVSILAGSHYNRGYPYDVTI